jgi:ribonucleoside-diphosphate reductase alpha chain
MSNSRLSDNAIKVAESRYFMRGEDWEKCVDRVAYAIAAAENNHIMKYGPKFAEVMYNLDFLPAGRIIRNAGRQTGSLFNCYHLPIGDSRKEIGQFYSDSLMVWGEGGGLGVNFSPLRPKGAPIKGVDGHSSGPVSFLGASDGIAVIIKSGGARHAAGLALMNVSHPDILRFIDAKIKDGVLSCYNISVAVTDDFLEAVESNDDWEFKFAQKSYGKIKARKIWDKVITNMVNCGEPGLLNWNNLIKNNSYYYDPIMGTNPCGEAALEPYGVCDLGSLVLPSFITGTVNTNWKKLEEVIRIAVRFLDDVTDVNKYVLQEIDIKAHNSRRVGLGIMGLADYLFAKKLKYGSEKALVEVERLMRFIRDSIYQVLVELAVEKGAFPKFEPVSYGKASFIRKLPASLRMDIKEKGVRCVSGMAIAPTGTISLIADTTPSAEPMPYKAYRRDDRVGERIYIHDIYRDILQRGEKIPDWYVDIDDLQPADHFETQAVVQKYTDGAVSKTINMPKGTTSSQLSKLTLEYIHDLKGVTVYVDGSKKGQVVNKVTRKEVEKYMKENRVKIGLGEEAIQCASGSCEV